jgi:hypothetical protein
MGTPYRPSERRALGSRAGRAATIRGIEDTRGRGESSNVQTGVARACCFQASFVGEGWHRHGIGIISFQALSLSSTQLWRVPRSRSWLLYLSRDSKYRARAATLDVQSAPRRLDDVDGPVPEALL